MTYLAPEILHHIARYLDADDMRTCELIARHLTPVVREDCYQAHHYGPPLVPHEEPDGTSATWRRRYRDVSARTPRERPREGARDAAAGRPARRALLQAALDALRLTAHP